MCVGGGGFRRPPSGFCKWGEKGLDATPVRFCKFWKGDLLCCWNFKQLLVYSLRNFLMCQNRNIILLVSQHEITKSIHFHMYMVTFKLSGLILHWFFIISHSQQRWNSEIKMADLMTSYDVSAIQNILGTFRSDDDDDYEYEFSVLSMRIRFGGRHFSKCACSEQKTRTRSRPGPPV